MKNTGLIGCEKLKKNDRIILFYTDNAKNIDIDIIQYHGEAKLIMYKVSAGKQSLDMHLGSYLGYLIGRNKNHECKYVIISKDTDYDNIMNFWIEKTGSKILRRPYISKKESKKAETGTAVIKPALRPEVKINLRREITSILINNPKMKLIAQSVADIAVKNLGNCEFTTSEIIKLEKQKKIPNILLTVKPIIGKYEQIFFEQITEKAGNVVRQKLTEDGIAPEIINYIIKHIVENAGKPNYKKNLYSKIINKYGLDSGKEYYALIKKLLP
ncbi:MAG: hypothetical protein K2I00_05050 [Ruminococcus sp.]|nr:hypothetical protein [Ruminococcus sp.]